MNDAINRLQTWFKQPFTASGDAVSWTLTLVFVLTIAFLWSRVLSHITE